jgi:glucosyltransferase Lgt1/2/3
MLQIIQIVLSGNLAMAYSYNPHRHVKIWLSKDKDTFLNLENCVRLVKMRELNPRDEIHFIYDSNLLSEKALRELEVFCDKYQIISKDVQKEVIPYCQTEEEKNLIEIYTSEITNLNAGGNLAVGSDILRWLKPVYELGTYTDFDGHVDTSKLPETILVDKPLLMNIGSVVIKGDVESVYINNDVVAVVNSQDALSDIQKIQKTIYTNCSQQSQEQTFIAEYISTYENRISALFSPSKAKNILKFDPNFSILSSLANLSKEKTAREVRKEIIDSTANNLVFGKEILKNYNIRVSDKKVTAIAAIRQRATLEQQLGWTNWWLLPKKQYKQMEALASMQDDEALLTKVREQTRMVLLKTSVVHTTGPGALMHSLFNELFYKKVSINSEVAPFSFAHYGLDKAFISKNSLSLHTSSKVATSKMQNMEIGATNDLSWLQEGQNAIVEREKKIIEAQAHMPQYFGDMRGKIENHIEKIKADLNGCFGFYRYKERQAKIQALTNILRHFDGSFFNVSGFNKVLGEYRTKDISASIGKSKTKELVDELVLFGQQAKYYMLTDENGKVKIEPLTQKTTVVYGI